MPISLKSTVAAPSAAYGSLKSSIALMDAQPGTRSWTVPAGVKRIRAFVVGGGGYARGSGGGYSEKLMDVTPGQVINYTVGAPGISSAPTGGTSSLGGLISATGGATNGGAPGVGAGGDINTSGGVGLAGSDTYAGGGAAGHAFGNGQAGTSGYGGGFSDQNRNYVDGWKIGLMPSAEYGRGARDTSASFCIPAGMGGGGCGVSGHFVDAGGIGGGGGGAAGPGGPGLVGIEVIA